MALASVDFLNTNSYTKLANKYKELKDKHLRTYFKEDTSRFETFSIEWKDFLFDYSKNRLDEETMELLLELANECKLKDAIEKMFQGDRINQTEDRAVLHTALRNRSTQPVLVDGKDVMPEIRAVLEKMKYFSQEVISGDWKGHTGKSITDVVNIGIGGSDLGPYMVCEALKHYKTRLICILV